MELKTRIPRLALCLLGAMAFAVAVYCRMGGQFWWLLCTFVSACAFYAATWDELWRG